MNLRMETLPREILAIVLDLATETIPDYYNAVRVNKLFNRSIPNKRKRFQKFILDTRYDNIIRTYSQLPNGKMDGVYRLWKYRDEIYYLEQHREYHNGRKHGLWIEYHNGYVIESNYRNDKQHGFRKKWYNGQLIKETNYIDDKKCNIKSIKSIRR